VGDAHTSHPLPQTDEIPMNIDTEPQPEQVDHGAPNSSVPDAVPEFPDADALHPAQGASDELPPAFLREVGEMLSDMLDCVGWY
jgi:hypothetical protein